jgi:LPS sulfotransferase NodH
MRTDGNGHPPRFLFILSTERSGSTLLSVMLGAHSGVIAPPELHLLAYPTVDDWRQQYPTAIKSLSFLLDACGLMADEAQVAKQFTGWHTEEVYQWLLAQGGAPRLIVDKTPKYARDASVLQRTAQLGPLYIWLIRHPLGVAASRIDLSRERRWQRHRHVLGRLKYPLFCLRAALRKREDVCSAVAYWSWVNTQIEQFLATIEPERQRRVHFEELVQEPRRVMECLSGWLDIPFESSMLNPRAHIPAALRPETGDPKVQRHAGIDPGVADGWRRRYPEQLLDTPTWRFQGVSTRELMGRWGIT